MFENVVGLYRGEKESPGNREIGPVRADLERAIGGSMSPAAAAQLLGVTHTALARWIDKGQIPTVLTPAGRRAVPVAPLVELYERMRIEREAGRRRPLATVLKQDRERAAGLSAVGLLEGDRAADAPHRRAELRSLAYHRAIARELRRPMVEEARRLVRYWREIGNLDQRYAEAWEGVLDRPLPEIRALLREDSQEARDLRQNSPFAGLLTEAERRKILSEIR